MTISASSKKMTLMGHLEELRRSLIFSLIAVALGMGAGLIFAKEIYSLLALPLQQVLPHDSFFIATDPIEAFMSYLKVGLLTGFFLALPVVFYQLWRFVAPALRAGEKMGALSFVLFSSAFFIGGAAFGYFVVFPMGFEFFVTVLQGTGIQFLPQMKSYLSFVIRLLIAFGIVFELPVLSVLLARLGILSAAKMRKARRYCIVGIFVVAALLTPPDVASQILMAVPLLVLFELSVILVRFFEKKKLIQSP